VVGDFFAGNRPIATRSGKSFTAFSPSDLAHARSPGAASARFCGTAACLCIESCMADQSNMMERRKEDIARLAFIGDGARIRPEQRARYERYLAEILAALGLPLDRDDTRATPSRLLQAWIDATSGYEPDPKLVTVFRI